MDPQYVRDLEAENLELATAIAALELRLKNYTHPQVPLMFPIAKLVIPSAIESL